MQKKIKNKIKTNIKDKSLSDNGLSNWTYKSYTSL